MFYGLNLSKIEISRHKIIEDFQLIFIKIVFCYLHVAKRRMVSFKRCQPHKRSFGIRSIENHFCGCMTVSGKMELILHDLKKLHRHIRARVVVHGGRIKVEYLTVHNFLRRPDVADTVEKFTPICASTIAFKPLIIYSEPLDDIFF